MDREFITVVRIAKIELQQHMMMYLYILGQCLRIGRVIEGGTQKRSKRNVPGNVNVLLYD